MLRRRTITKRQKREASKKRLGILLIFLGMILIAAFLAFLAFFEKKELFVSPLSTDQTSVNTRIEKLLKEKKVNYLSFYTAKDLSFILMLPENREVILDPNKNISEQLSSLQLILSQLKIDGKAFKRLDFRYQKPVITF